MANFTSTLGNTAIGAIQSTTNGISGIVDTANKIINNENNNKPSTENNILPSVPSADGNGLPFTKVINNRQAKGFKANLITWYVPEFGAVKMWINPESLTITNNKEITNKRTKGGYSLQYWGEGLTKLQLTGTTGSSGFEGINMLYEIYRAEQYAFDGTGLAIAGNNYNTTQAATNLVGGALDSLGNTGTALGGILGIGQAQSNLIPKNIPSMAQYAFTVEMYYAGVVYRGYFTDMTITESASNFNFQYSLSFIATQKRGYRVNNFGWQRSPNTANAYYPADTLAAGLDANNYSFKRGAR